MSQAILHLHFYDLGFPIHLLVLLEHLLHNHESSNLHLQVMIFRFHFSLPASRLHLQETETEPLLR